MKKEQKEQKEKKCKSMSENELKNVSGGASNSERPQNMEQWQRGARISQERMRSLMETIGMGNNG